MGLSKEMKLGVIEFPSCLHIASSLGYMDITSQLGKGWVPPTVIQLWNEDVAHLAAKQARKKNAREATSMGASFCEKGRVTNVTSKILDGCIRIPKQMILVICF